MFSDGVLFDGMVRVAYSQLYVQGGDEFVSDFELSFGGQQNGLCGAANPAMLFVITGRNDGEVPFRVELHPDRPAVDDSWEEIVEACFAPTSPVVLCEWGGMAEYPLTEVRPGCYRVRYCLSGMDAAHNPPEHGAAGDRYLLQLWLSPLEPDAVVKQTSVAAAHAHRAIERLRVPPTPEERAEARRRAQLTDDLENRKAMQRFNDRLWGDRPPTDRQRAIGGNVLGLARLDRALVDLVCDLPPAAQRAIARWAARRAYTESGLAALSWVAPALAAMDTGRPLPPPFGDPMTAFDHLNAEAGGSALMTVTAVPADHVDPLILKVSPPYAALPALFAVSEADPAQAALDALYAAAVTFGDRYAEFFADLRRAIPALDTR